MLDTFNIFGIFNLIICILTFFIIRKKFTISSFLFFGFIGLSVYSIPIYLDATRPMYFLGDELASIKKPTLHSKFIYFLFWVGFLASVIYSKDMKMKNKKKKGSNTYLKQFKIVCEIYTILYFSYFFLLDGGNYIILLLGRWLYLFLGIIYCIERNYLKLSIIILILFVYSIIIPDRTLIVISFFTFLPVILYHNKDFLKKYKFFLINLIFLLVIIIIFNKLFYNVNIKYGITFSFERYNLTYFTNVLKAMQFSFEPLMIHAHTEEALKNNNFETFMYIRSMLANLLIVPEYFGLDNDYYYQNLRENIPIDLGYGRAGSIFASTFLAFSYPGLLFFGFMKGYILIYFGNYIKKSNSTLMILYTAITGLLIVYLYRNSLDNFLSFIKQLLILYFFLKIQADIIFSSQNLSRNKKLTFKK